MSQRPSLIEPSESTSLVAGVDEAGRGCLAGPVVAGACILPDTYSLPQLDDSKKLKADQRSTLYDAIRTQAVVWSIGVAWPKEVDEINILQATFQAMGRAVRTLGQLPTRLLIDGNHTIPGHALKLDIPQKYVIGGDGIEPAISAASILAKHFRDKLMTALDRRYPGYGFAVHFGYGTKAHMAAIKKLGPCPMHRMTFKGVKPEEKKVQQGSLI